MTTRAKFVVQSITRQKGWGEFKEVWQITMNPVVGNSEENKRFYAATPSGTINLSVVPEAVGKQFDIGQEVYVDFTPIPKGE